MRMVFFFLCPQYLGDLVFISLAYNLLTTVPSFSLSSRASLVSLVLRGNNLDQIKGRQNLMAWRFHFFKNG